MRAGAGVAAALRPDNPDSRSVGSLGFGSVVPPSFLQSPAQLHPPAGHFFCNPPLSIRLGEAK